MNKGPVSIWGVLCLICMLALQVGCKDSTPLAPGQVVRDFRLQELGQDRFYLNRHRGRVVVLAFWATWCTHCKKELTQLNDLRRLYPPDRLTVAGICIDPENSDNVRETAEGLNYPVLLDQGRQLADSIGIRALPTTVVIGPGGRTATIQKGFNQQIYHHMTSTIHLLLDRAD